MNGCISSVGLYSDRCWVQWAGLRFYRLCTWHPVFEGCSLYIFSGCICFFILGCTCTLKYIPGTINYKVYFFLFLFHTHTSTFHFLLDKPWLQVLSCLPLGPCLQFLSRMGFSNPAHCSSIFHRVLLTHALALSASQCVHREKSL